MSFPHDISYEPWPPLSYPDFAATQHLLHMGLQAVGKLKLKEPFEPQWAEVALWLSSRGLTTGPIPYSGGAYEDRQEDDEVRPHRSAQRASAGSD